MEVNIMSLKTRIKNLANEQGIGLTALEAKLGFGNGTITKCHRQPTDIPCHPFQS